MLWMSTADNQHRNRGVIEAQPERVTSDGIVLHRALLGAGGAVLQSPSSCGLVWSWLLWSLPNPTQRFVSTSADGTCTPQGLQAASPALAPSPPWPSSEGLLQAYAAELETDRLQLQVRSTHAGVTRLGFRCVLVQDQGRREGIPGVGSANINLICHASALTSSGTEGLFLDMLRV